MLVGVRLRSNVRIKKNALMLIGVRLRSNVRIKKNALMLVGVRLRSNVRSFKNIKMCQKCSMCAGMTQNWGDFLGER